MARIAVSPGIPKLITIEHSASPLGIPHFHSHGTEGQLGTFQSLDFVHHGYLNRHSPLPCTYRQRRRSSVQDTLSGANGADKDIVYLVGEGRLPLGGRALITTSTRAGAKITAAFLESKGFECTTLVHVPRGRGRLLSRGSSNSTKHRSRTGSEGEDSNRTMIECDLLSNDREKLTLGQFDLIFDDGLLTSHWFTSKLQIAYALHFLGTMVSLGGAMVTKLRMKSTKAAIPSPQGSPPHSFQPAPPSGLSALSPVTFSTGRVSKITPPCFAVDVRKSHVVVTARSPPIQGSTSAIATASSILETTELHTPAPISPSSVPAHLCVFQKHSPHLSSTDRCRAAAELHGGFTEHPGRRARLGVRFSVDLIAATRAQLRCLTQSSSSRPSSPSLRMLGADNYNFRPLLEQYRLFLAIRSEQVRLQQVKASNRSTGATHPPTGSRPRSGTRLVRIHLANLHDLILPPDEVESLWWSHMLRPGSYRRDCLNFFGRVIGHSFAHDQHARQRAKLLYEQLVEQVDGQLTQNSRTRHHSQALTNYNTPGDTIDLRVSPSDNNVYSSSPACPLIQTASDSHATADGGNPSHANSTDSNASFVTLYIDASSDSNFADCMLSDTQLPGCALRDAKFYSYLLRYLEAHHTTSAVLTQDWFLHQQVRGYEQYLYLHAKYHDLATGANSCPESTLPLTSPSPTSPPVSPTAQTTPPSPRFPFPQPSPTIELVLRSHMLFPLEFDRDCRALVGRPVKIAIGNGPISMQSTAYPSSSSSSSSAWQGQDRHPLWITEFGVGMDSLLRNTHPRRDQGYDPSAFDFVCVFASDLNTHIASWLDHMSLRSAAVASKGWNSAMNNSRVWRARYHSRASMNPAFFSPTAATTGHADLKNSIAIADTSLLAAPHPIPDTQVCCLLYQSFLENMSDTSRRRDSGNTYEASSTQAECGRPLFPSRQRPCGCYWKAHFEIGLRCLTGNRMRLQCSQQVNGDDVVEDEDSDDEFPRL